MVEIIRKVQHVETEEIGELDLEQDFPCGEDQKCDHCGKKIEAKTMVFGYKQGYRNFKFHRECLNQGELFDKGTKARPSVKKKPGLVKPEEEGGGE